MVAMLGVFFGYVIAEEVMSTKETRANGIELYPVKGRERVLANEKCGRLGEAPARVERGGLPPADRIG